MVTKHFNLLRDPSDRLCEICILMKYSPRREQIFGNVLCNIEQEHTFVESTRCTA